MRTIAVAAAATLLIGWQPGAAHAAPATCSGVWVVVGEGLSCATEFGTGEQALFSAGHTVGKKGTMICQIDGYPDRCQVSFDAYWSYWHSTRGRDGEYGPWKYASVGAALYAPTAGDAEGWAFGPGEPPQIMPPFNSFRPGAASDDAAKGVESSPVPTMVTFATLAVGGTTLAIAGRRRNHS